MKAEDTVLKGVTKEDINNALNNALGELSKDDEFRHDVKVLAYIKEARRAGIKEVVDWIDAQPAMTWSDSTTYYLVDLYKLEAKLKEWDV